MIKCLESKHWGTFLGALGSPADIQWRSYGVLKANRLLALLPYTEFEMVLAYLSIAPLAAGAALGDDIYFVLSERCSMFIAVLPLCCTPPQSGKDFRCL
jgi:hypothetical protein